MIKGEKVLLRAVERGDIEKWKLWFNDPEIRSFLTWVYPYAERDGISFYERLEGDNENKVFSIITSDKTHIGSIGLHPISWTNRNAELGILIGEKKYHNKGYGSDSIKTLLEFAFKEMNLHRVYLRVFEFNSRAIACYRKIGFVEEGIQREAHYANGRYWNVIWMGLLKSEFLP